jgi:hypothetical protein
MNEILEIGEILQTNDAGFIVNHTGAEKIVDPWKPVVEAVREGYLTHLGDNLHSVYIRGSVARGLGRESVSDVDSIAVVKDGKVSEITWDVPLSKELTSRFPFCTGIEIVCLPHEDLMYADDEINASWRMMLKTQCVCIFGDDLAKQLPDYRPGAETLVHANDIRRPIERLVDDIRALRFIGKLPFRKRLFKSLRGDYGPVVSLGCAEIMKKILRTGFELVMEEEKVYTRDLYPCYKIFSKHFPEKEASMRRALELAVNPTSNPEEVLHFLEDFAPWLIATAERRYPSTSSRAGLRERLTSTWRDLAMIARMKR